MVAVPIPDWTRRPECVLDSLAMAPVAPQFPVRLLGRGDGLPSGQVHATSTDDQGRLWMATPNGLSRWDNSRVVTLTRRDGLSTHGLRWVTVGDDRVWVGTDVGLDCVHLDGRVEALVGGWRWGLANCVTVDPDGVVWVASAAGVVHSDRDGGWTVDENPELRDTPITRCATDRTGRVWVTSGHLGVLVRHAPGIWEPPERDDWRAVGAVRCLSASLDGSMLIGGSEGVVNVDTSGRIVREVPPIGDPVYAALGTRQELWVGTGSELKVLRAGGDRWEPATTVMGGAHINHLTIDRSGNVWAATDGRGVVEVEAVRSVIDRPTLPTGAVFSIRPLRDGRLLLGGDEGSGVYDRVGAGAFGELEQLRGTRVWDLAEDVRGTLWAASEFGLVVVGSDGLERVGADHPVLGSPARVLFERHGRMWCGTLTGLAIVSRDGSIETVDDGNGSSLGYVYSLTPHDETILIGTLGNGLWRWSAQGVSRVEGEGLTTTGNSYAAAVASNGTTYVVQDERVVAINATGATRQLAASDDALAGWSAAIDSEARLWVGGSSGLREYHRTTGALLRQVTLWTGVEGSEFTTSKSLLAEPGGDLLCGLNSGLAVVETSRLGELAGDPPAVGLESIGWSGVEPDRAGDGTWIVTTGRWKVEVRVFSTWPYRETSRRFRYRLDGFDREWSHPTSVPGVQFTSLPLGSYRLDAQAHSPLAGWGPVSTIATIDVRRRGLTLRAGRVGDGD